MNPYPRNFKASVIVSGIHAYLLSVFHSNVGITVLKRTKDMAQEIPKYSMGPYPLITRKSGNDNEYSLYQFTITCGNFQVARFSRDLLIA